jgi:hypothetical protein
MPLFQQATTAASPNRRMIVPITLERFADDEVGVQPPVVGHQIDGGQRGVVRLLQPERYGAEIEEPAPSDP